MTVARGRATSPAPLSFPAGPGGLRIAAPDDYTDTFNPPQVEYQTNRDGESELSYVEYSTDLDPNDTTIETTYVFFIKQGGEVAGGGGQPHDGLVPGGHVGTPVNTSRLLRWIGWTIRLARMVGGMVVTSASGLRKGPVVHAGNELIGNISGINPRQLVQIRKLLSMDGGWSPKL